MYYPKREEFIAKSKEGNLIPVYSEVVADMETPVSAFKKLGDNQYSYLLESVEGGENVGRYSFIGSNPFLIFNYQNGRVEFKEGKEVKKYLTDRPLKELEKILDRYKPVEVAGLPRFCGGAVGYLGYEMLSSFEDVSDLEMSGLEVPDSLFILTDTILIFDHVKHKIKIVANTLIEDDAEAAYQQAIEKIDLLRDKLEGSIAHADTFSSKQEKSEQSLRVQSNLTKEEFMTKVNRAKEYIRAGDIFQVVLSQRLETQTKAKPFDVYRTLRRINPSPYMYYLNFDEMQLVGSSPEMLVRVEDEVVETRPIAGKSRAYNVSRPGEK
jgi:anthranilate synthase component 1